MVVEEKHLLFCFQFVLLATDIITNSLSHFFLNQITIQLSVYVVQDLSQVISFILLFLLFFNTKAIESGLLHVIFKRFWSALAVCLTYGIMTLVLQACVVNLYWHNYEKHESVENDEWTKHPKIVCIFIFQRFLSSVYYFSYPRASNKLSDETTFS